MAEAPSGGGAGSGWKIGGATAAGAGNSGFFSGVHSMFWGGKMKRAQKKYMKEQGRARIASAQRAKAQYEDDAGYREQILQQSHYGRGLGSSSIAREDNDRFARAKQRAIENYDQDIALAIRGYDVLKKQLRFQSSNQYAQLVDQLVGIAGGAVSVAAS